MTYKRKLDGQNDQFAISITEFAGLHNNYGKCDQPIENSYGFDFDYAYGKPLLRPGMRKNMLIGYDNSVDGLFYSRIGGLSLVLVVQGGVLSLHPVTDVLAGIFKYYTWQELYDRFTWEEIEGKTWDDLFKGDNEP